MRKYLDKKRMVKAVGYRIFVIFLDIAVVSTTAYYSGGNYILGLLVLNLIKILGFYVYDILWEKPETRTPLRIIDRVLKILKIKNNG